jgi:type I restriction enzyme M protein
MTDTKTLSAKVWNLAHVLRDQGLSYSDYLEQITMLLFLKMVQENVTTARTNLIPETLSWNSLKDLQGPDLTAHYDSIIKQLAGKSGLLGLIFEDAQNRVTNPVLLKKLISIIDAEAWSELGTDVKGDLYESLLERNAQDVKGGAGQYFTPRPLIDAIVEVIQPKLGETIADPACGTGGFLLGAYSYLSKQLKGKVDTKAAKALHERTFYGADIVPSVVRLCAMNLFLHGLETPEDETPLIECVDSLEKDPERLSDVILSNPPFGRKSSMAIVNSKGNLKRETESIKREGFVPTSNKQLNFVQHIHSMLEKNGRAAVVVPDNVLFEGGAGETIRQNLLKRCDVHTLLRLPTGIFYAQGVKSNVLFFDKKPKQSALWAERLWVYDLRTNYNFTLKTRRMVRADLDEFVTLCKLDQRPKRKESERFRSFSYEELFRRDKTNLDIFWLKDEGLESHNSLSADVLASQIISQLEAALSAFRSVEKQLRQPEPHYVKSV